MLNIILDFISVGADVVILTVSGLAAFEILKEKLS